MREILFCKNYVFINIKDFHDSKMQLHIFEISLFHMNHTYFGCEILNIFKVKIILIIKLQTEKF